MLQFINNILNIIKLILFVFCIWGFTLQTIATMLLLLCAFIALSCGITALEMKQVREKCDKICRRSKMKSKCTHSCQHTMRSMPQQQARNAKTKPKPKIAPKIVKKARQAHAKKVAKKNVRRTANHVRSTLHLPHAPPPMQRPNLRQPVRKIVKQRR